MADDQDPRTLNPGIETVARTHNEMEAMLLKQEAAGKAFFVEDELAKGMGHHVLERYGKTSRECHAKNVDFIMADIDEVAIRVMTIAAFLPRASMRR